MFFVDSNYVRPEQRDADDPMNAVHEQQEAATRRELEAFVTVVNAMESFAYNPLRRKLIALDNAVRGDADLRACLLYTSPSPRD